MLFPCLTVGYTLSEVRRFTVRNFSHFTKAAHVIVLTVTKVYIGLINTEALPCCCEGS